MVDRDNDKAQSRKKTFTRLLDNEQVSSSIPGALEIEGTFDAAQSIKAIQDQVLRQQML